MIEQYTTGSHMAVQGTKYYQDLKIIDGQVKGNWWRKEGHRLDAADISDILSAKPDVLVIGTGYAGGMHVPGSLRTAIEGQDIRVIAERTVEATKTFNRLFNQGKDVTGAFHKSAVTSRGGTGPFQVSSSYPRLCWWSLIC